MKFLPPQDNAWKIGQVCAEFQWSTLMGTVQVDTTTRRDSVRMDVKGATGVVVLLDVDSTLAPTNVRFLAQMSPNGIAPWIDLEEGLWASMYFEDTDTAAGILKCYLLPVSGLDWIRISVIGTGTDQANFFTVRIRARAFFGPSIVAHA